MAWSYSFAEISDAEKHARRLSLDSYGLYAQLSTLLPVAIALIVRLTVWFSRRESAQSVAYDAVPTSPGAKFIRESTTTGSAARVFRRISWYLGGDIYVAGTNWGRRDQLIFGSLWTIWLVFLCFVGTGNDYNHLTKKFAAIGCSQFPIQYLLSLKYLNPVAYAFRSSHEEVNRWHRTLGRIVYFLLAVHAVLYSNKFVQMGVVQKMSTNTTVLLGLVGIISMTLLNTTALAAVREYSYRVFFATHLSVAMTLPVVIFFHVHHARLSMIEALAVILVDIGVRKFYTVTAQASLQSIPGADLVKITATVSPEMAAQFKESPGAHAYVNVPPTSRPSANPLSPSNLVFESIYSPFTVAAVSEDSWELTLVARQLQGPMTKNFGRLASMGRAATRFSLGIEGPYGVARYFPQFLGFKFDRVLLFAGGVGATFTLPIYHYLTREHPLVRTEMIWAVRQPGEATWPTSELRGSILDDDRVHLYLTGNDFGPDDNGRADNTSGADGEIELDDMQRDHRRAKHAAVSNHRRPDLKKIVDDAFRQGVEDRVAILVCGPDAMARELREYVGAWAKKGERHLVA
ncbi:ferric reductase like transmembrane component [Apiospora phragmitis]|uniref:Ferric reductase like transmembrane component n=1 Tax=Apiospora phragmitis TaxID=2905665 RepID=A0ABR1UK18_9PEZI